MRRRRQRAGPALWLTLRTTLVKAGRGRALVGVHDRHRVRLARGYVHRGDECACQVERCRHAGPGHQRSCRSSRMLAGMWREDHRPDESDPSRTARPPPGRTARQAGCRRRTATPTAATGQPEDSVNQMARKLWTINPPPRASRPKRTESLTTAPARPVDPEAPPGHRRRIPVGGASAGLSAPIHELEPRATMAPPAAA